MYAALPRHVCFRCAQSFICSFICLDVNDQGKNPKDLLPKVEVFIPNKLNILYKIQVSL